MSSIMFSGYRWNIKESIEAVGPGPNYFSKSCVINSAANGLKLQILQINGKVYSGEVYSDKSFGYGTYYFYLTSRIDLISPDLVLGLFTYKDDNNEIDIEFSKWNNEITQNSQYVLQPSTIAKHKHRFTSALNGNNTTHIIKWQAGSLEFMSLHGHYETPPDANYIINSWTYKGTDVPKPSTEKVRINLWKYGSKALLPLDNNCINFASIKKFEFKT